MKPFNLSEERRRLFNEQIKDESLTEKWAKWFLEEIEKQDKTFIQKLKERFCLNYTNNIVCKLCRYCKVIDTLAGDELSGCSKQNYAKSNYHKMFNSMSQKYGKAIRRNTDMEIKFDEFIKKLKEELDRALISKADKKIAKLNIDKLVKEFKGSDKK